MTIRTWVRAGSFPQPVRLGLKTVRWRQADVDEIMMNGLEAKPMCAAKQAPAVKPRQPSHRPVITSSCEPGWDLHDVATDYLIAELIRRGEYVKTITGPAPLSTIKHSALPAKADDAGTQQELERAAVEVLARHLHEVTWKCCFDGKGTSWGELTKNTKEKYRQLAVGLRDDPIMEMIR